MKISRNVALKINFVLDQLLPPFIRDNRFLMSFAQRALFGKDTDQINRFKDLAFGMTEEEFSDFYRRTAAHWELQGETDLNQRCIDAIVASVVGERVLEVGCGRGYLAGNPCREVVCMCRGHRYPRRPAGPQTTRAVRAGEHRASAVW